MRKKLFVTFILTSLLICSCATIEKSNTNPSGDNDPSSQDKLISLYDANSKYYVRNLKDLDTISSLRTFHHKDYDDVPFVDFNE